MRHLTVLVLLSILFAGCNEEPLAIPDLTDECSEKVLLIEELSGASCGNCPRATQLLKEITTLYPGKLIVYAIHGKEFSEPLAESKYDFRSAVGEELENHLRPWLGKPAAAVDRFLFTEILDDKITNHRTAQWLTMIETRCQTPKSIDLSVASTFDPETRIANISITTQGVLPIEGELRINVVITENHLIDAQDAGQDGVIVDYEHNHVFRDRITELTGDFLVKDLSVDQTSTKNFVYTVPDEANGEWKSGNMEVIAFVTEGDQQRGSVLQAAKTNLE